MPKKRVGPRPVKSTHEKLNPVARLIIVMGEVKARGQAQTDEERDYLNKKLRFVEGRLRAHAETKRKRQQAAPELGKRRLAAG